MEVKRREEQRGKANHRVSQGIIPVRSRWANMGHAWEKDRQTGVGENERIRQRIKGNHEQRHEKERLNTGRAKMHKTGGCKPKKGRLA